MFGNYKRIFNIGDKVKYTDLYKKNNSHVLPWANEIYTIVRVHKKLLNSKYDLQFIDKSGNTVYVNKICGKYIKRVGKANDNKRN